MLSFLQFLKSPRYSQNATFQHQRSSSRMAFTSTVSRAESPASFTCFKNLPMEIRLQIWKEVSFHPRDVDIKMGSPSLMWPGRMHTNLFYCHSACLPPAVLHTSHEARNEALKWYELSFATSLTTSQFNFSTPSTIYFNWKVGRLCVVDYNQLMLDDAQNQWPLGSWSHEGLRELYLICNHKKLRSMAWNVSHMHSNLVPYIVFAPVAQNCQIGEFVLFDDTSRQFPRNHRGDAVLLPSPLIEPSRWPTASRARRRRLKREESRINLESYWVRWGRTHGGPIPQMTLMYRS